MLVLQILGWIFLAFLALVAVVLFVPFKIAVVYPKLKIIVKFGPVQYTLFPLKPLKIDKKGNTARKTAETKPKELQQSTEELPKTEEPVGQTTAQQTEKVEKQPHKISSDEIVSVVKEVLPQFTKAFRKLVFNKLFLKITVADADKAKCAQYYGILCIATPQVVSVLESTFKVKHKDIEMNCDWEHDTPQLGYDIVVSLRACDIIVPGFVALIKMLPLLKTKKEVKK